MLALVPVPLNVQNLQVPPVFVQVSFLSSKSMQLLSLMPAVDSSVSVGGAGHVFLKVHWETVVSYRRYMSRHFLCTLNWQ